MQAKPKEKQQATDLRKRGYSLLEISAALNVSKSTASLWVRNVSMSETAKARISHKRKEARDRAAATKRTHVDNKFIQARTYGASVVRNALLNKDASRLICALLYWCEGTKLRRGEMLAFTNSDPEYTATFLQLLRAGFPVDERKLRLSLHIHEYHDAKTQLQFWSKLTTIPLTQCYKPYLKPHTGKQTREGYQGCVSVRYLHADFGRRLEGIAKAFLNKRGP